MRCQCLRIYLMSKALEVLATLLVKYIDVADEVFWLRIVVHVKFVSRCQDSAWYRVLFA